MKNRKQYFSEIGRERKPRRTSAYYWNEISHYIGYFSHEDSSVLEIGCGSGDLLAAVAGNKKTGIDFSESHIAWAKEKHAGKSIDFRVMDANALQLEGTYDLIVLSNLVGFVEDIERVFTEVRKVCHPTTKVIVQYYNSLWEPLIKFAEWTGLK